MEIRPIRNQTDYEKALREIELLFNAPENTPEYDQLDILQCH
jgi:HTH-type transcriptional regulator/antitoxin HigA